MTPDPSSLVKGLARQIEGLSLAPKLKHEHLQLTSYLCMRVDLAAQVSFTFHTCSAHTYIHNHPYIHTNLHLCTHTRTPTPTHLSCTVSSLSIRVTCPSKGRNKKKLYSVHLELIMCFVEGLVDYIYGQHDLRHFWTISGRHHIQQLPSVRLWVYSSLTYTRAFSDHHFFWKLFHILHMSLSLSLTHTHTVICVHSSLNRRALTRLIVMIWMLCEHEIKYNGKTILTTV